eukprot:jgi/Galph1/2723/GphlegSOOS_G1399.1
MTITRWKVTWSGTVCHAFFIGLVYTLPSVILSSLRNDLQLSMTQAVLPLNVYKVANLICLPLAGAFLIDRYGCRSSILMGLCVAAILSLLYALVTGLWQLLVIDLGYALCNSVCGSAAFIVLVSSWFEHRLGTALGLVLSGFSVAGVLFPVGLGTLLELFGWRTTVFLSSLCFIGIILPLAFLTLYQGPLLYHTTNQETIQDNEGSPYSMQTADTSFPWRELSSSLIFWLLGFLYFSLAYAQSFPFDYLVTFVHEDVNLSFQDATVFLSLLNGSAVISKLLGGIIGDYTCPFRTLVGSSFIMFLGILCLFQKEPSKSYFTMTHSKWQLASFSVLFGIGSGSLWNNLYSIVPPLLGRSHLGFSQNTLSALHYIGSALGSMIGGIIKTRTDSFTSDILVIAAISFLNLIAAFYLTIKQRKPSVEMNSVPYDIQQDNEI